MKDSKLILTCLIAIFISTNSYAWQLNDSAGWKKITKKEYTLYYTAIDMNMVNSVEKYLQSGIGYVEEFFDHPFLRTIDVYIFPDRSSLDKQWQKDWNDSTFKSECWMIASGVAHRLDMLSPNAWPKEACDHNANDPAETRKLIWHELTHVYHGQYNPDHTFSYIEKMDWFVEGLATYISGQLTEGRLERIRQLIQQNKTPVLLDDFWKGPEKYGLSGSIVEYIDKKYGRKKLFQLLKLTNKNEALKFLEIEEADLLKEWKNSLQPSHISGIN